MSVESGYKNKKLQKPSTSECCDVIISAIGLFYALGGKDKELKMFLENKINKWFKRTI